MLISKCKIFFIVKITLSTQSWGSEISWKIVDKHGLTVCSSREAGAYSSYTTHDPEECFLAPTSDSDNTNKAKHAAAIVVNSVTKYAYKLICEDTYGDGWHRGRVYIQGICYCDDFTYGSTHEVDLVIQGKL